MGKSGVTIVCLFHTQNITLLVLVITLKGVRANEENRQLISIPSMQMRNPKEIENTEYNEFYKKTFNEFLDPLAHTHFTTEVCEFIK